MVYRSANQDRWAGGSSFVGSFIDEPGQAVILLRGDIDAATVSRLVAHIDDVLSAAIRFVTIDARAIDSYDEALLDLLGRTQQRLGMRKGLLQVSGLHPALLTGPDPTLPAPDQASDRLMP